MKTINEIVEILNRQKLYLTDKYGLKDIAIFGSFSRGDQTNISDVDILVEFDRPIGLDFVMFGDELEELLGVKVDVVTRNSLSDEMYRNIQTDLSYV
ncbi:MAG: nucleotidyltransferase family protein [Melioribacteraceae bacterium]|nr:nucleotidyltransferase family protein [Melioribacteraceae bacterium]